MKKILKIAVTILVLFNTACGTGVDNNIIDTDIVKVKRNGVSLQTGEINKNNLKIDQKKTCITKKYLI